MCRTNIACHRYAVFDEFDTATINIPSLTGLAKETLCGFSAALCFCMISFAFVSTRALPHYHVANAESHHR